MPELAALAELVVNYMRSLRKSVYSDITDSESAAVIMEYLSAICSVVKVRQVVVRVKSRSLTIVCACSIHVNLDCHNVI